MSICELDVGCLYSVVLVVVVLVLVVVVLF